MLVLYMNCSAYGVFCLSIQFLSRHSLCLLIYFYLYMNTRKPIKDKKELLKLSNIDLDKDSEREIIYKFGLLMGDWNITEISLLADYIYYQLYLYEKSIKREFSFEMREFLDSVSDWDFYNGRGERWSYDKEEFDERIKKVFGIYSEND